MVTESKDAAEWLACHAAFTLAAFTEARVLGDIADDAQRMHVLHKVLSLHTKALTYAAAVRNHAACADTALNVWNTVAPACSTISLRACVMPHVRVVLDALSSLQDKQVSNAVRVSHLLSCMYACA